AGRRRRPARPLHDPHRLAGTRRGAARSRNLAGDAAGIAAMSARLRRCGFTLVELLVSLAIGSLLIIGVVQVYSRGHAAYTVNENVARLQESARFALAVLEPDIELAGYYGYTSTADAIRFVSGTEP